MIYAICLLILCVGGYVVADTIYRMGVRAGRELSAVDRAHIKKQAYDEGRHAEQARQAQFGIIAHQFNERTFKL